MLNLPLCLRGSFATLLLYSTAVQGCDSEAPAGEIPQTNYLEPSGSTRSPGDAAGRDDAKLSSSENSPPSVTESPTKLFIPHMIVSLATISPLHLPRSAKNSLTERDGSPVARFEIRVNPMGHWFVAASVNRYLKPSSRAAWEGDFAYSLGYENDAPRGFSVIYSSSDGDRFLRREYSNSGGINRGNVTVSWNLPALSKRSVFTIDKSGDPPGCKVAFNFTPSFTTALEQTRHSKEIAILGCTLPFGSGFYGDVALMKYFHGQQPWDGDFSYSVGWMSEGRTRVGAAYSNYTGTRYPWRTRGRGTGRFLDGSVSLSLIGLF